MIQCCLYDLSGQIYLNIAEFAYFLNKLDTFLGRDAGLDILEN